MCKLYCSLFDWSRVRAVEKSGRGRLLLFASGRSCASPFGDDVTCARLEIAHWRTHLSKLCCECWV